MAIRRLLIANRGEIAIRIARAAATLGIETVAVFSEDDSEALHTRRTTGSVALVGSGPAAYLNVEQIVAAATDSGGDALHPGYGLLSERADLARACTAAGIAFVGPTADTLDELGNKVAGRLLAHRCQVPTLAGTSSDTHLDDAYAFFDEHGALMVKAVLGGGGRGIRAVTRRDDLAGAIERCRSEALGAFGDGALYIEQLVIGARHIEVQIVGDGADVVDFGERECTLQRRNQKIIEVAPSPSLRETTRREIIAAARIMAATVRYRSLGTFEFLVVDGGWYFIEANPRVQVEHTVTEAVTGADLVGLQLRIAGGESLAGIGLAPVGVPNGYAVQLRINTETLLADGSLRPTGGTVTALEWPTGPGIRIDTAVHVGMRSNPRFDSLFAKLIVHSPGSYPDALAKAARALDELRIDGLATSADVLARLVAHAEVVADRISTRFIDDHAAELATPAAVASTAGPGISDPLAVLAVGKRAQETASVGVEPVDDDRAVVSPMPGTVVVVTAVVGGQVRQGDQVVVLEAMKMEHVIVAPFDGVVAEIRVDRGTTVGDGEVLLLLDPADVAVLGVARAADTVDLDLIRPDLAEVLHRHAITHDAARPDSVAKRRAIGQRTARENLADLCDEGSFVEYGSLVVAAQRRRRSIDDLIQRTAADGMVAGLGTVNGSLFDDERARCMVLSYDYMVLAGTQGLQNHRKKDRMFELAERLRTPVVFFTEGGGGRPGDTDGMGVAGLDCRAFQYFARLSGLVPLIGVNAGRCFAGNAAILGCCDVVIATRNSSIGMGGPAMIEGGGLGVFHPDEVGPTSVQAPNGVIDILVDDDIAAVSAAKQYLSYFQGSTTAWEAPDQRLLRHIIPENRLRVYDVRRVIDTLADTGSVLEVRRHFGVGMVTALARIEGRPVGIIANNPMHLAGAIDSDGADKAARFMQLCDAYDIPLVMLCDTPGMMVGPDVEQTALVRHCSRLFVTGASLTVPVMTIVLRKGYGLGAQAMAAGSFHAPLFTVAWPTGEFGGMGLEGAVKLGYRNELAAIDDPTERAAMFSEMVARMYEHGKAVNMASHFEIDDVIDPADSRRTILAALRSFPPVPVRITKKRPCVDTW